MCKRRIVSDDGTYHYPHDSDVGPSRRAQEATVLLHGLTGGRTGDAIEAAEKAGQNALVRMDVLPRKGHGGFRGQAPGSKVVVEWAADAPPGLVVESARDDLFANVRLPDGWVKQGANHAMWSYLLDAQKRVRAAIFYKAAYYDREAFLSWHQRYRLVRRLLPEGAPRAQEVRVEIQDAVPFGAEHGPVLHVVDTYSNWQYDAPSPHARQSSLAEYDTHEKAALDAAKAWLTARRPEWEKVQAYWEESDPPK